MSNVTRVWNPSSPAMARDFLMKLHLGDQPVTGVAVEGGRWVEFRDATDAECVRFAKQIAEMIEGSSR